MSQGLLVRAPLSIENSRTWGLFGMEFHLLYGRPIALCRWAPFPTCVAASPSFFYIRWEDPGDNDRENALKGINT